MPDVSTDDGRSWHAEFDRCRIAFGYVCHVHVCVDMLCPWGNMPTRTWAGTLYRRKGIRTQPHSTLPGT